MLGTAQPILMSESSNKTQRASRFKGSRNVYFKNLVAEPTGLEPATSDVTGRRSNQLNYDSAKNWGLVGTEGFEPPTSSL